MHKNIVKRRERVSWVAEWEPYGSLLHGCHPWNSNHPFVLLCVAVPSGRNVTSTRRRTLPPLEVTKMELSLVVVILAGGAWWNVEPPLEVSTCPIPGGWMDGSSGRGWHGYHNSDTLMWTEGAKRGWSRAYLMGRNSDLFIPEKLLRQRNTSLKQILFGSTSTG